MWRWRQVQRRWRPALAATPPAALFHHHQHAVLAAFSSRRHSSAGANLTMRNVTCLRGTATGGGARGGGVAASSSPNVTILESSFLGCSAPAGLAGALYVGHSTAVVAESLFSGSVASQGARACPHPFHPPQGRQAGPRGGWSGMQQRMQDVQGGNLPTIAAPPCCLVEAAWLGLCWSPAGGVCGARRCSGAVVRGGGLGERGLRHECAARCALPLPGQRGHKVQRWRRRRDCQRRAVAGVRPPSYRASRRRPGTILHDKPFWETTYSCGLLMAATLLCCTGGLLAGQQYGCDGGGCCAV